VAKLITQKKKLILLFCNDKIHTVFQNRAGRDYANRDVDRYVRAVFLTLEALIVEEVATAYNAKRVEVFREEYTPGTISLTTDASSLNAFCPSWSA